MIKKDSQPQHVAIIMDGNRRWAKQRGLSTNEGHKEGAENLRRIAFHAFETGTKFLTVYAFSTENWSRDTKEVDFLMSLIIKGFEKYLEEFNQKGIKLVRLGSRSGLGQQLLDTFDKAEEKTKANEKGTLGICFNYGGRQEIIDAVKKFNSRNGINMLDEKMFGNFLYQGDIIPDIDLVIRTSGEQRISNFMLWRIAYSEFYFTNVNWPAFSSDDYNKAITEYNRRNRRFGGA